LSGVDKKDVLAVSFSGQMMGCLCIDRSGTPLKNSIIWADMRSTQEEKYISERISEERFYRITGHKISSSYSLEKLMWIKNNEPDIYKKTYKILNAKDYIVFKMTGKYVTDYSDASGTNLFDLNTFKWSDEIIEVSGIDGDKLPKVVESTKIVGEITKEVACECGLEPGTKVVLGGGDGMCASVGAGSVREGVMYNCLGSSSWICTTSKEPIFDKNLRTFNWAHIVPGLIGPCGTMQAAGASFGWIKNEICKYEVEKGRKDGVSHYKYIDEEIASSVPGSNGIIFLPYLLGERSPRWNADAKGAFIGLKMENKREDVLRAVVEGIGLNLKIILNILKEGSNIEDIIVIGGLAKSRVIRKILADIYGLEILKINHLEEATSIGAAVTAGVGIGVLKDFDEVSKFIKVEDREMPTQKNVEIYNKLLPLFDEAYYSLTNLYSNMSKYYKDTNKN
jgi:xylulokinase